MSGKELKKDPSQRCIKLGALKGNRKIQKYEEGNGNVAKADAGGQQTISRAETKNG